MRSRVIGGLAGAGFVAALLLGASTATAATPSSVTLAAAENPVPVPADIRLTATADQDVGPTPYYIRIYDDDRGVQLASCSSGKTCSASVSVGWAGQENPADRHFHAEVSGSSGVAARSGQITVSIQPYQFEVSLAANPETVQVPGSATLTATANRDVGTTPYYLRIIDDDTGAVLASCSTGASCTASLSPGWAANADPRDRHFHAELVRGTYMPTRSDAIAVGFLQHFFPVDLKTSDERTDSQGITRYTLTATTNRDMGTTPYYLRIRDADNQLMASCGSGVSCSVTDVVAGSYRATVEDVSGREFGTSSVDGIDLDELALVLESAADICFAIATAPTGTHFQGSSATDLGVKCLEFQRLGLLPRDILERLIPLGGATLAAWILTVETLDDTAAPWPPPPVPPDPPYRPEPPQVLPGAWGPPIEIAATRIRALNPALANDVPLAREIARRCVWLAAQAIVPVSECGMAGLPIFVTGGNVLEVTEHDLRAIGKRPASWLKLNYDGVDKSRSWLLTDDRCRDLTGEATGMDCHEYPYNKTEQGGQSGDPEIAPVPSGPNRSQGGSFGVGINTCAMRPAQSSGVRGDAFLVVPVPVAAVPTFWLCNGKSASSQPPQPPSPGA
jgi:hypothetical protein